MTRVWLCLVLAALSYFAGRISRKGWLCFLGFAWLGAAMMQLVFEILA